MLRGLKVDLQPATGKRRTVLVVDDERLNRMVIARSLEKQFDVVEAGNGNEAVERVATGNVDLVVMDIHLPGMDGYELTQQLKWMNPGMFLPVVLMTANNDEEAFARGLQGGADDFLAKPITPSLLEAKIRALLRVVEILEEQRDRNEELNRWRARAEQDFGVAQKLFEHIAERGRFDFPNLEIRALSLEAFNGDIVLAAPLGKGRLRLLVGDFAGHGLGAALGAMPVSDVFYAMTRRRFPIEAVVREIGGKLYRMFPRHQFLAAAVADIDTVAEKALVWNGGLPASVAVDAGGASSGARRRGTWRWACNRRATWCPQSPSCRCRSAAGWCCTPTGSSRRARRAASRSATSGSSGCCPRPPAMTGSPRCGRHSRRSRPATRTATTSRSSACATPRRCVRRWSRARPAAGQAPRASISIRLGFDHTALREPDPLAPLRILIEASPALVAVAAELYTIACELFVNAVDHGVLRLDSKIKAQPGGFDEYYRRRETGCASSPADRSPWCSRCCPGRAAASPRSASPTTDRASARTCCAPCAIPRRARAAACRWSPSSAPSCASSTTATPSRRCSRSTTRRQRVDVAPNAIGESPELEIERRGVPHRGLQRAARLRAVAERNGEIREAQPGPASDPLGPDPSRGQREERSARRLAIAVEVQCDGEPVARERLRRGGAENDLGAGTRRGSKIAPTATSRARRAGG